MIYLTQSPAKSKKLQGVQSLTLDAINKVDVGLSDTLHVYQDVLRHKVDDFTIVNAIKLYSGTKFYIGLDEYNNLIVHGDLTIPQYDHLTNHVLTEGFKSAIRANDDRFYVFNITESNDTTLLYAYNDAYLYLPHDLRAIFNTQYFHETRFIADSHRIMFYDLLNKVKNEDHDGYIIANDDEFLAKITLKENKIVAEAEAEQTQLIDNSRNAILEQITQDIGFTNLSLATESEVDDLIEYYKNGKRHKNVIDDYDIRYMRLAREFSTWSKDPSTRLGAVAISEENKIVLSQGYNGFPRGIKDDYRLYIRKLKYNHIVHAEMNVIYNAYQNGISLKGSTLYVFGLPVCLDCANAIIQVAFKRIVICDIKNDDRWNKSFQVTLNKFKEAGILVDFIKVEDLD